MLVPLSRPITVSGRTVAAIELRPPGKRVFDVMRSERGPPRFSEAAVVRFAARLSEHGQSTLRRLPETDLLAIAAGVELLYAHARRRYAARSAWTETAKAPREAG